MVPAGIGSGVIGCPEGYNVTNADMTTDPRFISSRGCNSIIDKKEYQARIVGFDRSTDVAVLKIESSEPLPLYQLPIAIILMSVISFKVIL